VATAAGRSALAVVRLSGPDAERICRRVASPYSGWPIPHRTAVRCRMHAPEDPRTPLDDGIIVVFPAPASYTGETVVELTTHGGEYAPRAVYSALIEAGARPAAPGEFTERAVLNGKLDLLRAEGIAEVIDARSRASHRVAVQLLSGHVASHLGRLRDSVTGLEALLAYDIDFPEEDDGRLERERVADACDAILSTLDALLSTLPMAQLARDGATVVLAGPPNAGKSSLLNALVGEARVIVSEVPGTTRDAVEVLLDHEPWPLRLVDTAGLRETADPVERLGIEVSERYLAGAHAVIACADTETSLQHAVDAIRTLTTAPIIGALTKCDREPKQGLAMVPPGPALRTSALTGAGLSELLACVTTAIAGAAGPTPSDAPIISRARHRAALRAAHDEMHAFRDAWRNTAIPAPVAAVHVRAARGALDELIGVVDVEDVFARVFATFCVGK
jgi:tRNA modification GTPase